VKAGKTGKKITILGKIVAKWVENHISLSRGRGRI
jgi:hypothetical protein